MSEFNPADLGYHHHSVSDLASDTPVDRPPDDELPRREREGLPSSYRMRADSHYVELLTSAPAHQDRKHGQADVGRRQSEEGAVALKGHARDARDEGILAGVAEGLSTIGAAAAALATDVSPMSRRVNVDLISAHVWRASWMLLARSILAGTHRGRTAPEGLGPLLARVKDGFAAECRLTSTSILVSDDVWNVSVDVDAEALVAAVAGAVIWTLGATDAVEGTVITLSATTTGGRLDMLEVSQGTAARVGHATRASGGTSRSGEDAAGLGASVAKAAARLHDADATFLAGDGPGTVVRFSFRRTFA